MAKKISQLVLAGDVTVNDLFQVVDKEDTTMAPTGTNKRITAQTLGNFLPVTATGSSASRTLKDRFADTVNVKDFGAVGDGVTDDTLAIQAAINSGMNVFVPKGTYRLLNTLSISGSKKVFKCDSNVYFNYTGTTVALTLTGSYHDVSLGEIGAINGASVISYWNLGFSRIYIKAIGQCSTACIFHNASLQTENEGNCIWTIDRLEAGSVPYGIKIDSHSSYIHEGSLFDVKVLFSATNTSVVVGSEAKNTARWNRFVICPDASGITPLLFDVYNNSNSFHINEWQGVPSVTHVKFNTNVYGNYLFASPGVQSKLQIVDNGNNFKFYPDSDLFYKLEQGANSLKLDDNSVGIHMISGGGGFRVTTATTERFRIAADGQVYMKSLPTSATGLSSGSIWKNGNVLNIVP